MGSVCIHCMRVLASVAGRGTGEAISGARHRRAGHANTHFPSTFLISSLVANDKVLEADMPCSPTAHHLPTHGRGSRGRTGGKGEHATGQGHGTRRREHPPAQSFRMTSARRRPPCPPAMRTSLPIYLRRMPTVPKMPWGIRYRKCRGESLRLDNFVGKHDRWLALRNTLTTLMGSCSEPRRSFDRLGKERGRASLATRSEGRAPGGCCKPLARAAPRHDGLPGHGGAGRRPL